MSDQIHSLSENPAAETLLRFHEVAAGYGSKIVLNNLSFSIEKGDYLAIVGSNGAGKTTLLRTLLGLLSPVSGRIETPCGALHFGYVPQLSSLDEIFPLTSLEIVVMGLFGRLGAFKRPGKAQRQQAREALQEVGIGEMENQLFREMSGGQKQRTLIARALVAKPDILILDEHTNNLDIVGERAIMGLVDEVHTKHQIAVVMVTHSLSVVANHAKHIGLIRQGRFDFAPVERVMQSDYLSEFYGVPLRVLEIDGVRAIL
ncbi:zinc transport system ATP-binding protein [Abditibacterium utsteinense]|uniref:Zinc transport system ATP-binding protein n=1 Tax=Abditibacterium utsteinense TaxID=1960156 RepID=A0A2S8SS14_9BACT|nr:metal ABC transporter ATP-binding protein [Abditibacterium utsteinense]PQV63566.1 zinc transport system ATP-binding protein [Abditibacterium utsteinense]